MCDHDIRVRVPYSPSLLSRHSRDDDDDDDDDDDGCSIYTLGGEHLSLSLSLSLALQGTVGLLPASSFYIYYCTFEGTPDGC